MLSPSYALVLLWAPRSRVTPAGLWIGMRSQMFLYEV